MEVHLTISRRFFSAKGPQSILNHCWIDMSTTTNFVIKGDTVAVLRNHDRDFGEQTFCDFTRTVTVPLR